MNSTEKAKTINRLMIHLRDDCNININGSKDKLQLTQYGYYHGYKGYRFIKKDRIRYHIPIFLKL